MIPEVGHLISVAKIVRPHGIRGEVKVILINHLFLSCLLVRPASPTHKIIIYICTAIIFIFSLFIDKFHNVTVLNIYSKYNRGIWVMHFYGGTEVTLASLILNAIMQKDGRT